MPPVFDFDFFVPRRSYAPGNFLETREKSKMMRLEVSLQTTMPTSKTY